MLPVVGRGFLNGRSSSGIIRSSEATGGGSRWSGRAEIQASGACFGLLRSIFWFPLTGNRQDVLVYVSIDLQYVRGQRARLVFMYSHVSLRVFALP